MYKYKSVTLKMIKNHNDTYHFTLKYFRFAAG